MVNDNFAERVGMSFFDGILPNRSRPEFFMDRNARSELQRETGLNAYSVRYTHRCRYQAVRNREWLTRQLLFLVTSAD